MLIVRDDIFSMSDVVCHSCVYTLQKVGKAGIVLNPKQLQAVCNYLKR